MTEEVIFLLGLMAMGAAVLVGFMFVLLKWQ